MSLVNKQEFDELVRNSTHYIQDLMNRVVKLEEEVEELKKKPAPRTRKAASDES